MMFNISPTEAIEVSVIPKPDPANPNACELHDADGTCWAWAKDFMGICLVCSARFKKAERAVPLR